MRDGDSDVMAEIKFTLSRAPLAVTVASDVNTIRKEETDEGTENVLGKFEPVQLFNWVPQSQESS